MCGGYRSLYLSKGGEKTFFYVHVLVALLFIGPRPDGKEVAHGDGNGANPALSNLRYATPVENDADKIKHGTRPEGTKNGQARLTEDQVIEIRRRSALNERRCDLAEVFGTSAVNVTNIVLRKSWRHI